VIWVQEQHKRRGLEKLQKAAREEKEWLLEPA